MKIPTNRESKYSTKRLGLILFTDNTFTARKLMETLVQSMKPFTEKFYRLYITTLDRLFNKCEKNIR